MTQYPIYEVRVNFIEDREPDDPTRYPKGAWWTKGLPANRTRNGISKKIMFRNNVTERDVYQFCKQMWGKYRKKNKDKNPSLPKFVIKFLEHEEWCLGWFDHWTFDIGQTDKEALESFENFLDRKNVVLNDCSLYREESKQYCAMGAEDRWRWRGFKNSDMTEETSPPCRCDGCKKQDIIRIVH